MRFNLRRLGACLDPVNAPHFEKTMAITVEQTQADLTKLIELTQRGEEVVILSEGQAVARLTGISRPQQPPETQEWLADLAELRERISTGKTGTTVEEMITEDRGD